MTCLVSKLYFITTILGIFTISQGTKNTPEKEHNYALSIVSMAELLYIEEALVEYVQQKCGTTKNNTLLSLFFETLPQHKNHTKSDAEAFASSPLNSFSLIRRLHMDWPKWLQHFDTKCADSMKIDKFREKLPTSKDLKAANAAIIRIQETYELSVEDLSNGLLIGKQYNEKLTALDCFAIGQYVFETKKKIKVALKWYQVVLLIYAENYVELYEMLGVGRADIWHAIAKTFYQLERDDEALHAIHYALTFRPHDEQLLAYKSNLEEFITHEKLCRGEIQQSSQLHCRYNSTTTPFLKLAPLKMEEVSLDPYIVLYKNIIYDSEVEILKNDSLKIFARGQVGRGDIIKERTSNTAHFSEAHSPLLRRIHQRFVDMSGFDFGDAEALQIVNYGLGGHYYNHVDFYDIEENPDMCERSGDRLAAILIYMNNVEQGGATAFANIRTVVQPEKGSALLWYNLDNAGNGDDRTMHASCPVIVGSKWVGIKLAFERRQMFIKPCYKV